MAQNHLKIYKGVTFAPQSAAPSNPEDGDIYYDDTLSRFRAYENGSWKDLIVEDADGINYVMNPGAEADASHYNVYNDGAADTPVDGNGGSVSFMSVARTTTASEVLRGDASLKISKSSGNAQGEGVSTDLVQIDGSDLDGRLQISFDYKNLDSNYVSGDVKVFIYDTDNLTLIGPVENDDDGDLLYSENGRFVGQFPTSSNGNDYRVIFHVAGTTSANWAISVDRVKVSPIQLTSVSIERQEVIDVTGSGDFTGGSILVSRKGNVVNFLVLTDITHASSGAPNSAAGLLPEWARPATLQSNVYVVDSGASVFRAVSTAASGSISLRYRNSAGSLVSQTSSSLGLGLTYSVDSSVNLVSNNELTQKTVKVSGSGNGGTSITANVTNIDFTETLDPFNAWDGTTFTAPKDGHYEMKGVVRISPSSAIAIVSYINGSAEKIVGQSGSSIPNHTFYWSGQLDKGDTLSLRLQTSETLSSSANHWMEINSLPDFINYGVLNPNTEIVETTDTSDNSGSSSLSTWAVPNSAFSIDLTPGTWDLSLLTQLVIAPNVGGSVFGQIALATSSTPGSGIIFNKIVGDFGATAGSGTQFRKADFVYQNFVTTSNVTIYVQTRADVFSTAGGTPTSLSTNVMRNALGSGGRLTARRVK